MVIVFSFSSPSWGLWDLLPNGSLNGGLQMGVIRSPLTSNGMILQALLLKTKQQKPLNNGWLQMKVSFPQLTLLQKVIFGGFQ